MSQMESFFLVGMANKIAHDRLNVCKHGRLKWEAAVKIGSLAAYLGISVGEVQGSSNNASSNADLQIGCMTMHSCIIAQDQACTVCSALASAVLCQRLCEHRQTADLMGKKKEASNLAKINSRKRGCQQRLLPSNKCISYESAAICPPLSSTWPAGKACHLMGRAACTC